MTKIQRKYVDYVLTFTRRMGYQPTLRQIAGHFGKTQSNVYLTLKKVGLTYASFRKISKEKRKELNRESFSNFKL